MTKKLVKAFIFDLDGVLQDPSHRIKYWHNKEYEKFNSLADKDPAIKNTCELCRTLMDCDEEYQIIFMTGRTELWREETLEWLRDNVFSEFGEMQDNFSLIMRPNNLNISDAKYKQQAYQTIIEPLYDVIGVFEDRESVVDMWQELGLTVYALPSMSNLQSHEFVGFTASEKQLIELSEYEFELINFLREKKMHILKLKKKVFLIIL